MEPFDAFLNPSPAVSPLTEHPHLPLTVQGRRASPAPVM
jgi:hypothetical protein